MRVRRKARDTLYGNYRHVSPAQTEAPGAHCSRCVLPRRAHTDEVVIALAVLGTMASGVYLGLNAIDTYAVSSRLYSKAQTAAQTQIDLILSREPFDISASFNPALSKIPVD